MKKVLFGLIVICALFISSCAATANKQLTDTYVYTTNYKVDKEFDILGQIEMSAENNFIFYSFVKSSTYTTFDDFVIQAKAKYPEADALINCYCDVSTKNYFLGMKTVLKYHATAIKCK